MFNIIFWFPFIASIKQIMQYMKHMDLDPTIDLKNFNL